jgi:hypothetical protein
MARGDALVDSLAGAFAFCIVDLERGRTLAAADRMGIWRLHYLHDRGRLLVSTSLDALVRECDTRPAVDIQALYDYVYFHMIPAPRTIYAGVRTLRRAELLSVERDHASTRRYWRPMWQTDVADTPQPITRPRAAVAGSRALAVCGRDYRVLPERRPRQFQRAGRRRSSAPRSRCRRIQSASTSRPTTKRNSHARPPKRSGWTGIGTSSRPTRRP